MILDSIGAGVLDQVTIYNMNHAHSSAGWFTSPDGLNYTLDQVMPVPPIFHGSFIISTSNSELEGSEEIVRTLHHSGVATGTLVMGCNHWVTVRGVHTDAEPKPGNSYEIRGFLISNPWPPTPSFYTPSLAPPPPHSDPDACGSGGNRGVANEYAAYSGDWTSVYFGTGCDVYGVGHPQFISVVDSRRGNLGNLRMAKEKRLNGDNLIPPGTVRELMQSLLEQHRLYEIEHMAVSFLQTAPGQPILVQRLDLPDSFYYLVPMQRGEEITALVSVDALHGTLNGTQYAAITSTALHHKPDQARKLVYGKTFDLGDGAGRVTFQAGISGLNPMMVWRPCAESRSPYYPFYQVTSGSKQIYIGYDGTIYPRLHELGRG